jgi:HEPN domain-containing protein
MLRFFPGKFLIITQRIDALTRALPDDDNFLTDDEKVTFIGKLNFKPNMDFVLSVCGEAKLSGVKSQVERIVNIVTIGPVSHRTIRRSLVALNERIYDALSESMCLQIPPNKAEFYESKHLFGEEVSNNFPSANYDIEEAGKCYAAGRYTACVFHLMRVMEIGVKAVASGLGILTKVRSAQPSWGEVLRLTNDEIQANNKSGAPSWTPEKRGFFENVQADLMTVKNAWRNTTMHVENSYDEERAEDVYNAVKGFMRHLAKHLDESGSFTP